MKSMNFMRDLANLRKNIIKQLIVEKKLESNNNN